VADTIALTCTKPFHTVTLEPSLLDFNPQTGTRVVQKAKQLKFHNYRFEMPADWMPLLEVAPCFVGGARSPKVVFLEEDALSMDGGDLGPRAVRGAVTAPVRRTDAPPSPDWDDLGARVLSERIAAGEVKDLLSAMAWESANKKRKTVLQAMAAKLADGDADEPESGPIAESFEAEAA
jgi:hypothetical protein